jgi:hypothetical protein
MNVPSGNDQRRDVKKIPGIYIRGDESGKNPRGPGSGVGRSLHWTVIGSRKIPPGIKKN